MLKVSLLSLALQSAHGEYTLLGKISLPAILCFNPVMFGSFNNVLIIVESGFYSFEENEDFSIEMLIDKVNVSGKAFGKSPYQS